MLIPITSDFLPTNRYFLSNYGLENKKNRLSFCNGEIWFFCAENKEIPVKISAAPEGENTGPLKGRRFVLREIISQ